MRVTHAKGVRSSLSEASLSLLSAIDPESELEAVLFLRRTGIVLASWTARGIPTDVLTVMAATMLASIETMVGALGSRGSDSVRVETDDRRILSTKVGSQSFLVVIAPKDVSPEYLQTVSGVLGERLGSAKSAGPAPQQISDRRNAKVKTKAR